MNLSSLGCFRDVVSSTLPLSLSMSLLSLHHLSAMLICLIYHLTAHPCLSPFISPSIPLSESLSVSVSPVRLHSIRLLSSRAVTPVAVRLGLIDFVSGAP